ncbi:putative lipopolysaccharide transport protein B (ABC superfamily, atp_bind) (LptB) (modular protein) [Methylacidiphilum fumariolicum SolV]|uniref:Lipopolysaccharide transport protein B (ABC superfamily, atp_bind) (LptB) (Modular protein) n=2 Tax=Candidatus Methylacidiphilum fumarolicum TaxID=591154 RepID=A0ABN8XDZ2_9BACT|nr:LPS export ABC transporter ATP-binding protein [Candidatus Methylacidiphilum fumarolicum]CAI9085473.1 Putative lipopolysaccharide transport protein B (ABC superfamily, atp_bind) (LptB) (Modular protein) [Candidatus Methylacidiphilum fumarolicum]CCG91724.1 putative lipopolysaccharide transport protein B (ABC superfamily, atp_bind) (LptB) (modular protein) [Methylacidiphilum fumariolicum SolV]
MNTKYSGNSSSSSTNELSKNPNGLYTNTMRSHSLSEALKTFKQKTQLPSAFPSNASPLSLEQPRQTPSTKSTTQLISKGPSSKGVSSEALIRSVQLVKEYGGRKVVNGVDLVVNKGEIVGLLGPNGAGKTTTFYMLVGLVTPTKGKVFIENEDVTKMPMYKRARKGLGYLPQEESVFRKLTVEENLMAILEFLDISKEERMHRLEELIRDFGLEKVKKTIAMSLSGGEKRRLSIARALTTSPSILLLDEPFSGVDPLAVYDLQQLVLSLKERGVSVLITDHNVRETLSIVDRAYLIYEGKVMSHGTSEFLINDPITRELYLGPRFSM